jgi:hypothetical protein
MAAALYAIFNLKKLAKLAKESSAHRVNSGWLADF